MTILEKIYKMLNKPVPYYAKYSLGLFLWKPLRKFINVVIIPTIPFNSIRIIMYRMLGYNIGKNVFIGMKCYMDDMEPELTTIEDNVTISYECKFAAHGKGQGHTPIIIRKSAYLGLGCIILSGKNGVEIGENAIIGAGSLVNKNIPANTTVAGVPAKSLKNN